MQRFPQLNTRRLGIHGLPYGWPRPVGGVVAPVQTNWFVDHLTDPNGTTWPAHSPNIDFNVDGNPWVQRGPAPVGSTDIQTNLGRQLDIGDGQGRWIDVDLPSITGDVYAEVFHLLNAINPGWMGIQIRGTVAQPGSRWIAWHQASANLGWLNSPGGSQSTGFVAGPSDVIQLIVTANGASVTCIYNNLTTGVFSSQTRVASENLAEVQHGAWQRTVFGAGTQDFYEDIMFVELSEAPTEVALSRFTGANGTLLEGAYVPDVGPNWGVLRGNNLQFFITGNKAEVNLNTATAGGSLIVCDPGISDVELTCAVTLGGTGQNNIWFRTNGAGEGVLVRINIGGNTLGLFTWDGSSLSSLASVGQTYNAGDIVVLKIHARDDSLRAKDLRRNVEVSATSSFNENDTGVGFGEELGGSAMLVDDFRVTDAWPV